MNLLNFANRFPNVDSCMLKFKEYRDKQTVKCPLCGGTDYF